MILAEKLLTLRTRAGLSQEDLAERLNVSRQSVSKWESGASVPGIDKILELSRLYGISTDYLLKDELETLPGEIVVDTYQPEPCREVTMETAAEYLSTLRKCGRRIALGVALCILSPAPMFAMLSMHSFGVLFPTEEIAGGIGCGVVLVIVAAAVALFICSSAERHGYAYLEEEKIRLDYGVAGVVEKQAEEYRPVFYRNVALGVALCILSCVPILIAGAVEAAEGVQILLCGVLLALVALGAGRIVQAGIRKDGYDRLLQRGDYTAEKKRENKRMQVFDSAYWCAVAALYLGVSFHFFNWHISWVIWPVAGAVFAGLRPIAARIIKR